MTRAAAILKKAADLLEKDGWVQGDWRENGARCASQAIYDAQEGIPGFDASDSAWAAMRRHIGHRRGLGIALIARWNDEPGRTQVEVVSALRDSASFLLKESPPDDHSG